jgi:Membrane domain of glycerophosphoryl diester phosphodiesterase
MPGGVPLRPLTVGDMLSGAFTLIRRNPVSTLGLAAIIQTLAAIATTFLSLGEQHLLRSFQNRLKRDQVAAPGQVGHDALHFFASFVPYLVVTVAIALIVQSVLTGMLTGVFGRGLLGHKISIGQAWTVSRAFWVLVVSVLVILITLASPFLLALIVVGLALAKISAAAAIIGVLGGIALVPLTIWISVSLSLSIPVVVLEGVDPITAVRRSWRLVRGSWWRVFGILLLTGLIVFIVALVIQVPFTIAGAVAAGHSGGGSFLAGLGTASAAPSALAIVISTVGGIVGTVCSRPVAAGVTVLLYADMRMRKEGMDLLLQQAGQTQSMNADQFSTLWQRNTGDSSLPGQGGAPGQGGFPGQGGVNPGAGQTGW